MAKTLRLCVSTDDHYWRVCGPETVQCQKCGVLQRSFFAALYDAGRIKSASDFRACWRAVYGEVVSE